MRKPFYHHYPVLWMDAALWLMLALAAPFWAPPRGFSLFSEYNYIIGLVLSLPLVLLVQVVLRSALRRFGTRPGLRRTLMMLPALWVAWGMIGMIADDQRAAVKMALSGKLPAQIRNLAVFESAWTDYSVDAYFECEPTSLRSILEQPPFERVERPDDFFSFEHSPMEELRNKPPIKPALTFVRRDVEQTGKGLCLVHTNPEFTAAYVEYVID